MRKPPSDASPFRRLLAIPEGAFRPAGAKRSPRSSSCFRIHRRRGFGHQAHAALRLGKRDDVADRVRSLEDHHDPVEAEGDAAVGRRAEGKRVEQEPEARDCASSSSIPSILKTRFWTSRSGGYESSRRRLPRR
jgi:hypothetical protein